MKTREECARAGYRCDGCKRRCKEEQCRFRTIALGREVDTEGGVEPLEDWILKLYCESCWPEEKALVWWGSPNDKKVEPDGYGFYCDGCSGAIPEGSVMWMLKESIEEYEEKTGMVMVHNLGYRLVYCEKCMPGAPIVHWEPRQRAA